MLSRKFYLRSHLMYHCKENFYVADIRSPQLNIIRAIFDRRLATYPLAIEGGPDNTSSVPDRRQKHCCSKGVDAIWSRFLCNYCI